MRFYGNGVVWDPKNDKRLCKFSKAEELHGTGFLDTDDEDLQAELKKRGYKHDDGKPEPKETSEQVEPAEVVVTSKLKATELREIGKKYDLTFPASTSKDDMVAAINEAMEKCE